MGKVKRYSHAPPFLDLPRPFCGAPRPVRHRNATFCGAPRQVRHRMLYFCGARGACAIDITHFVAHWMGCATECCISVAHLVGCAIEYGQIFPTWSTDVGPTFFLWRTSAGAPQNNPFLWRTIQKCATEV